MAKCCDNIWLNTIIGTPPDLGGGGEEPVLSDYCVQWSITATNVCFPCSVADEVNGDFSGSICGGTVVINDLNGIIGNNFAYDNYNASFWYAQVIRPIANAALDDLGYYASECFGLPNGPFSIPITDSNCYVQCYTATFDVDDVDNQGFTFVGLQTADRVKDLYNGASPVIAFSDPGFVADAINRLVTLALCEPSITVEVIINSPTNVTLNICSVMNILSGFYGITGQQLGPINFTQV